MTTTPPGPITASDDPSTLLPGQTIPFLRNFMLLTDAPRYDTHGERWYFTGRLWDGTAGQFSDKVLSVSMPLDMPRPGTWPAPDWTPPITGSRPRRPVPE